MKLTCRHLRSAAPALVAGVCFCGFWLMTGAETKRPSILEAPAPNAAAPIDYYLWLNKGDSQARNNAFDAYLAAYRLLRRFEGDWGRTIVEPWSDNAAVTAWLLANQEGLELFRRAAARSDYFFRLSKNQEFVEPRLQALLLAWEKPPGWRGHLEAAMGLLAAGWRVWLAGNEEPLRENALLVLRAARHLQGTRWPISRLIGDGAACYAYNALRSGLARSRRPMAWAASLKGALALDDPPPPFNHACSLLRYEFWDLCQRVFLPRGADGKWPVHRGAIQGLSPRLEGEQEAIAKQLEAIGMETSLRESDAYYDRLERWNALPYHLAAREPFPLDRLRESSANPLVQLQGQLTMEVRTRVERAIAQRRATHLIVHLLLHKERLGSYPDRLGRLEAAGLESLRRDPFSGRDFVYRLHGDGFILYSLGDNLTDEGGRHDPEWASGDHVFWPVQQ